MNPHNLNTPDWDDFGDVLKLKDIAKVLEISLGTLKNRMTNGFVLPDTVPFCGKHKVFRKPVVVEWYNKALDS